jgi:DNA-binding MarR family transcriptional regulator
MARQGESARRGHVAEDLILTTFRANGLLTAAGEELAAGEGLTAARWQVLGALATARAALTVPQIARRMGLTRQSVQATVNRLLGDELVEAEANPEHRRSPLIRLTKAGRARYRALERRQKVWLEAMAAGMSVKELETTARVLGELSDRIEAAAAGASAAE